jgi:hypothetical protein
VALVPPARATGMLRLTVVVTSGGLQHRIQAAQASRWKAAD